MAPERYETLDGSTPDVTPLAAEVGLKQPLSAFTLLEGGDVFESRGGRPPAEGPTRARAYVSAKLELKPYGAPAAQVKRVQEELIRQLAGNLQLIARMEAARLTAVEAGVVLVAAGRRQVRRVERRAAGQQGQGGHSQCEGGKRLHALESTPSLKAGLQLPETP